eukprot:4009054-Amphidinium_carterae.2
MSNKRCSTDCRCCRQHTLQSTVLEGCDVIGLPCSRTCQRLGECVCVRCKDVTGVAVGTSDTYRVIAYNARGGTSGDYTYLQVVCAYQVAKPSPLRFGRSTISLQYAMLNCGRGQWPRDSHGVRRQFVEVALAGC